MCSGIRNQWSRYILFCMLCVLHFLLSSKLWDIYIYIYTYICTEAFNVQSSWMYSVILWYHTFHIQLKRLKGCIILNGKICFYFSSCNTYPVGIFLQYIQNHIEIISFFNRSFNIVALKIGQHNIMFSTSRSKDNALRWMPKDLTGDKSKLVEVMAWCSQATSHYLS